MNMENQSLVTNEPIGFEKWPVQVEDFTHRFKIVYGICLKLSKKTQQKIRACNWLGLETLRFGPIMPKISPDTQV
jgi:hypothetical protein